MPVFPSIYRAKATRWTGTTLTVLIPQVFGEAPVTVTDFVGSPTTGMGWVFFQGGNPEFPVWTSGISTGITTPTNGGGTGTDEVWIGDDDPIGAHPTIELWFDTNAPSGDGGGGTGVGSYVYNQTTPSATWVIIHNLGFRPNVTVEDSAGSTIEGEIVHDSVLQLTLTFSAAFSGVAYLS